MSSREKDDFKTKPIGIKEIEQFLKIKNTFEVSFENASESQKNEFISRLTYFRAQGSSSLKRITKFKSINADCVSDYGDGQLIANSLIESFIRNNSDLSVVNICKINYALLNQKTITSVTSITSITSSELEFLKLIRNEECYVGAYKCYPPEEILISLQDAINSFCNWYNCQNTTSHNQQAILNLFSRIAKMQNAIIRIHPFPNGNGRVATLLGDWFLIKEGFLPQTFRNKYDFLIGDLDNKFQNDPDALENHITKVLLNNVYRSYSLLC